MFAVKKINVSKIWLVLLIQDEESVKNLSAEDLFKRHVKRAKKVRAR